MKKLILLAAFAFLQCTSSVYLQPHIYSLSPESSYDTDAGIFIAPEDMTFSYQKFNFLVGKNIRLSIGSSLRDLTSEAFLPFYNRVYAVGNIDYAKAPHIIEVKVIEFKVTSGFDTHVKLRCIVSDEEGTLFDDEFSGKGRGYAIVGLADEDDPALEEIKKSAEKALTEAFEKIQIAFNDSLKE